MAEDADAARVGNAGLHGPAGRIRDVVFDPAAPLAEAGVLVRMAVAAGPTVVDLQNVIATARQQLRFGVESPMIANAVRPAVDEHHQRPRLLRGRRTGEIAVDRHAVAGGDLHRRHRAQRLRRQIRTRRQQRLGAARLHVNQQIVARPSIAAHEGDGELVVPGHAAELDEVVWIGLGEAGVDRRQRVLSVDVDGLREVMAHVHAVDAATVVVAEQLGAHVHVVVPKQHRVAAVGGVVQAQAIRGAVAAVRRVIGAGLRAETQRHPARGVHVVALHLAPIRPALPVVYDGAVLLVDADGEGHPPLLVDDEAVARNRRAGDPPRILSARRQAQVQSVRLAEAIAAAGDENLVGRVRQDVEHAAPADSLRSPAARVDGDEFSRECARLAAQAPHALCGRPNKNVVRDPDRAGHLALVAELVARLHFHVRVAAHLERALAVLAQRQGEVLAAGRNGHGGRRRVVRECADRHEFGIRLFCAGRGRPVRHRRRSQRG